MTFLKQTISINAFATTFLMPFSKYSQYPMVGRISANGIKNVYVVDRKKN